MLASATPVKRFVAPGPRVAKQTLALPVSRPWTSAMKAAPCSWRVWRKRILESRIASSTAMIFFARHAEHVFEPLVLETTH